VLLVSALVFYSEEVHVDFFSDDAQVPSDFTSIPGTFYWCMVTLLTVGYGDEVPVTTLGKTVAGLAMICTVVVLALPISVIGTQFTQHWVTFKKKYKRDARSAIAFGSVSQLVDNLSDHVQVLHWLRLDRLLAVEDEFLHLLSGTRLRAQRAHTLKLREIAVS
jgi:Ion channel